MKYLQEQIGAGLASPRAILRSQAGEDQAYSCTVMPESSSYSGQKLLIMALCGEEKEDLSCH